MVERDRGTEKNLRDGKTGIQGDSEADKQIDQSFCISITL
jgi:hypothetical protein